MGEISEDTATVKHWLDRIMHSVATRDLDGHMALVSKKVQVYGVPGNEVIDYRGWERRRRNEFNKGLLMRISYGEPQVKIMGLKRISFNIEEKLHAHNGHQVVVNKDIVLEREDDDQWRVVEEQVRNFNNIGRRA
ncbi:MAG TPA: hypothetical protein VKA50_01195 [Gammaproteobacteria bacterium]|nr:hypothetical protein [Gammaproteobacteria bacterium]